MHFVIKYELFKWTVSHTEQVMGLFSWCARNDRLRADTCWKSYTISNVGNVLVKTHHHHHHGVARPSKSIAVSTTLRQAERRRAALDLNQPLVPFINALDVCWETRSCTVACIWLSTGLRCGLFGGYESSGTTFGVSAAVRHQFNESDVRVQCPVEFWQVTLNAFLKMSCVQLTSSRKQWMSRCQI